MSEAFFSLSFKLLAVIHFNSEMQKFLDAVTVSEDLLDVFFNNV